MEIDKYINILDRITRFSVRKDIRSYSYNLEWGVIECEVDLFREKIRTSINFLEFTCLLSENFRGGGYYFESLSEKSNTD